MKRLSGEEWYAARRLERRVGFTVLDDGFLPLTSGKVAVIDPDFAGECSKHQWYFTHGYARTGNSSSTRTYLHHFVLSLADIPPWESGLHVDHINRDPLDCRCQNLRWVERWQNQVNRALQSNNTSGFRGVYWDASRNKWAAHIKRRGRMKFLGYFDDPTMAAVRWNQAALERGGGVVLLNKVS